MVRIEVKGLTAAAVEQLVDSAPFGDVALAEQLLQLTDGNPLFLDELLRQMSYEATTSNVTPGQSRLTLSTGTPEAVKELVSRRVSRLPEDVIRFLHAAAVAGPECDATMVAVVAELSPEQRIDAVDRAVESRLLRRVGDSGERYGFSHALVRDAIYGQLPRSRRVRLHHQIALTTERAHLHAIDAHINELAHHFYMGAALGDADKAATYSYFAGDRALPTTGLRRGGRSLHPWAGGGRGLRRVGADGSVRCPAGPGRSPEQGGRQGQCRQQLREGGRRGPVVATTPSAWPWRPCGPDRRATSASSAPTATRSGLLEEARSALSRDDSHLRAMVLARLSLVKVYEAGVPERSVLKRTLALSAEAVSMSRRLNDRVALGYALNARFTRCGAPSRPRSGWPSATS